MVCRTAINQAARNAQRQVAHAENVLALKEMKPHEIAEAEEEKGNFVELIFDDPPRPGRRR